MLHVHLTLRMTYCVTRWLGDAGALGVVEPLTVKISLVTELLMLLTQLVRLGHLLSLNPKP